MNSERPRVLFCITAYNGEAFVRRTLESAKRLETDEADIDVVVLDDASPAPGFSGRLADMCAELGILYYCTPRNLGIPRNVSLGMLAAVELDYDYVVISNSDVIYARNLVNQLVRVSRQEGVGSVTAWSNNVSLYSLPNDDPDVLLADQRTVDWIGGALADHYGDAAMDIPAGISFSMLVPTDVIREVGVMDPVFGRGYCEETDWSLRSLAAKYRIALAPGTFVYHQGRGSSLEAGLVHEDLTTVPENEAIIDMRYPLFRTQVESFINSGILQKAHRDAQVAILRTTGRAFGYTVNVSWLPPRSMTSDVVHVQIAPSGTSDVTVAGLGFSATLTVDELSPEVSLHEALVEFFQGPPLEINLLDSADAARTLAGSFGGPVNESTYNYPARV